MLPPTQLAADRLHMLHCKFRHVFKDIRVVELGTLAIQFGRHDLKCPFTAGRADAMSAKFDRIVLADAEVGLVREIVILSGPRRWRAERTEQAGSLDVFLLG
jgi:hypothetical protein